MKKIFLILIALLNLGVFCGTYGGELQSTVNKESRAVSQNVVLQLSDKHQFEFAGFYAAKEKGFYKQFGLEVNFKEAQEDTDVIEEVLADKSTFGITSLDAIRKRMEGKPILLLVNYLKRSPIIMVTQANITSPGDLKGSSVALSTQRGDDIKFQYLFKTFGFTFEEVTLLPYHRDLQDFIKGKVDAIAISATNDAYTLAQEGIAVNVIDPVSYGFPLYETNLIASEALAKEHPKMVQDFVAASRSGWQYALEHREEMINILLKKYNTQNKKRDHLQYEARQIENRVLPEVYPLGSIHAESIKKIEEIIIQQNPKLTLITPKQFIWNQERSTPLSLNEKEKAFLAEHPVIRVASRRNLLPHSFTENQVVKGYAIDYMKQIEHRLGIKFEWVYGDTQEELEKLLCQKSVDIFQPALPSETLKPCASYAEPYFSESITFLSKKNFPSVGKIQDVFDNTIALPAKNDVSKYIKQNYGDKLKTLETENIEQAIEAVSHGRAEVAAGRVDLFKYFLARKEIENLKLSGRLDNLSRTFYPAVRKDQPLLYDVIKKAQNSITLHEVNQLHAKWFSSLKQNFQNRGVPLTIEEEEFLQQHPDIEVMVENGLKPISFINDSGKFDGVTHDIFQKIEQLLNIKIHIKPTPYNDLISAVENQSAPVVAGIATADTPGYEEHFLVTNNFAGKMRLAAFKRKGDTRKMESFDDIEGKKVALYEGTDPETVHTTSDDVLYVTSVKEGAELLISGKADLYIDPYFSVIYELKQNYIFDVDFAFFTGFDYDFAFFVNKEWAPLQTIFNKAIAQLETKEIPEIRQKWSVEDRAEEAKIDLAPEEKDFLEKHPTLTVSNGIIWPPFAYVTNGEVQGYTVDLLKMLAKKIGIQLKFEPFFNLSPLQYKNKKLDMILAVNKTPETLETGLLTDPIYSYKNYFFVEKNTQNIDGFSALKGKKVAVVSEGSDEAYFKTHYPKIAIIPVKDTLEKLKLVSNGGADAFLGVEAEVNYLAKKSFINNLKNSGWAKSFDGEERKTLHFMVQKEHPELLNMLNKALNTLTPGQLDELKKQWIGVTKQDNELSDKIKLTPEEQNYLQKKSALTMCVQPDWLPFERINEEGKHEGIMEDLLTIIMKRIGDIPVKLHSTKSWQESLVAIQEKRCDFLPMASDTPERRNYLNFTKSFMSTPIIITTKNEEPFVDDIDKLIDKKFGIIENRAYSDILKNHHRGLQLVDVKNTKDGLNRVSHGEIYGYIDSIAAVGYQMQKASIGSIKISGKLDFDLGFNLATRRDEPLLLTIFQKALDSLNQSEIQRVVDRWVSVKFEQSFDYKLLWKWIAGGALLLLGVLYWNRKLAKFNHEMAMMNRKLQSAHGLITKQHGQVTTLLHNSGEGFLSFSDDYLVESEYSKECTRLFPDSPIAGVPIGQLLFPDNSKQRNYLEDALSSLLATEDDLQQEVFLSLLPSEISYQGRCLSAEYKLLTPQEISHKYQDYIDKLLENNNSNVAYTNVQTASDGNKPPEKQKPTVNQPVFAKSSGDSLDKASPSETAGQEQNKKRIMLILKDITQERHLAEKAALEQKRLTFVVNAIRHKQDFFEILDKYYHFDQAGLERLLGKENHSSSLTLQEAFSEIYREIHTFKGHFAQQDFPTAPQSFHRLESQLSDLRDHATLDPEQVMQLYRTSGCRDCVEEDLKLIREILGEEFFDEKGNICIPEEQIVELENSLAHEDIRKAAELVKKLCYVPFGTLLESYSKYCTQLAERLEKELEPFEILGGKFKVDPKHYNPFVKTLIHVFRNAVDHGLESPDERIEADKDEIGHITCTVRQESHDIFIEITDDGRGIDSDSLREKAIAMNLHTEEEALAMTDEEAYQLIFVDGLSTNESVTDLSGRGVGLAAVKAEIARLGGTITVQSEIGVGTVFLFRLPLM